MNLTSYNELTTTNFTQHTFSPVSQFTVYCPLSLQVGRVIAQAD